MRFAQGNVRSAQGKVGTSLLQVRCCKFVAAEHAALSITLVASSRGKECLCDDIGQKETTRHINNIGLNAVTNPNPLLENCSSLLHF